MAIGNGVGLEAVLILGCLLAEHCARSKEKRAGNDKTSAELGSKLHTIQSAE